MLVFSQEVLAVSVLVLSAQRTSSCDFREMFQLNHLVHVGGVSGLSAFLFICRRLSRVVLQATWSTVKGRLWVLPSTAQNPGPWETPLSRPPYLHGFSRRAIRLGVLSLVASFLTFLHPPSVFSLKGKTEEAPPLLSQTHPLGSKLGLILPPAACPNPWFSRSWCSISQRPHSADLCY